MRVTEPAADLAIALALASSVHDQPLPGTLIALGEVGLAGDVRRVGGIKRRLAEAARLGFAFALVPRGQGENPPAGMRTIEVSDVVTAVRRSSGLHAVR